MRTTGTQKLSGEVLKLYPVRAYVRHVCPWDDTCVAKFQTVRVPVRLCEVCEQGLQETFYQVQLLPVPYVNKEFHGHFRSGRGCMAVT